MVRNLNSDSELYACKSQSSAAGGMYTASSPDGLSCAGIVLAVELRGVVGAEEEEALGVNLGGP